jgi:hypothetical protein
MDKGREEFEKFYRGFNLTKTKTKSKLYESNEVQGMWAAWQTCWKSRDEEIKKLNQDCKNLVEINNNQAELMESRDAKIEKLHESSIEYAGYNDNLGQENLNKQNEIKKLRAALDLVIKNVSVNQRGIAESITGDIDIGYLIALKDGE